MKNIRVLLVCGSGASSGFMATNIRKAATKKGIEISVLARSEAEIENYINDIDCLMIGPHLQYLVEELEEKVEGTNIKVALMDRKYYSLLDGDRALDHIISLFE